MEARTALKKQLKDRYDQLGRRVEIMYEDRLDGRISAHMYDQKHKEATNEQQLLSKKLESLESDYLSILERGINILDLSQNAAEIYKSKKDDERRALMRDLFSNLRLNGKSLEVERTPLVAAIAKKVEQEKELIKTFEPTKNDLLILVEARFNAISPIWLAIRGDLRIYKPKFTMLALIFHA